MALPALHRASRLLVSAVLLAGLTGLGNAGAAAASGTVSMSGSVLVYSGDATPEQVYIDKEPVRDDRGATVGYIFAVNDARYGGFVTGTGGCGPHKNFDAWCPFPASLLQVDLGGGADHFATQDEEGALKHPTCPPAQASVPVRLDGGPGDDYLTATPLADTIDGGPGFDAIYSFGGADTIDGGPGVDLIETYDGGDIVDGGPGDDVIHVDLKGRDGGCRVRHGKSGNETVHGGAGSDAITSGDGDDRLDGGSGNDDLIGDAGSDTLLGGTGNDLIWSRDGQRDHVDCGSGKDLLEASDPIDVVTNCETRHLRPR